MSPGLSPHPGRHWCVSGTSFADSLLRLKPTPAAIDPGCSTRHPLGKGAGYQGHCCLSEGNEGLNSQLLHPSRACAIRIKTNIKISDASFQLQGKNVCCLHSPHLRRRLAWHLIHSGSKTFQQLGDRSASKGGQTHLWVTRGLMMKSNRLGNQKAKRCYWRMLWFHKEGLLLNTAHLLPYSLAFPTKLK